jgi:hypothetical protein
VPTPTAPNVAQADSVRVVVVKGFDAVTWYNAYKPSPQVHAQPVTGYGDQAFYDGYALLSVLKGDSYLRVAVAPAGAPPSLPPRRSWPPPSFRSCSRRRPRPASGEPMASDCSLAPLNRGFPAQILLGHLPRLAAPDSKACDRSAG